MLKQPKIRCLIIAIVKIAIYGVKDFVSSFDRRFGKMLAVSDLFYNTYTAVLSFISLDHAIDCFVILPVDDNQFEIVLMIK